MRKAAAQGSRVGSGGQHRQRQRRILGRRGNGGEKTDDERYATDPHGVVLRDQLAAHYGQIRLRRKVDLPGFRGPDRLDKSPHFLGILASGR